MSEGLYVAASAILTAIGRAGDAAALAELKESAGHLKFDTGIVERNGDLFLPQKTAEELCYEVQTPFASAAYDVFSQIQAAFGPLPAEQAAAAAPRSRRRAPASDTAAATPNADPVSQALAGLPEPSGRASAETSAPAAPGGSGRGRGRGASSGAAAAATSPTPSTVSAPEPELQTAGQARIQELRQQADTSVVGEVLPVDAKALARLLLLTLRAQVVVLEEIVNAG